MTDRLLLTQRDRVLEFTLKLLGCLAPTVLLSAVLLAMGGPGAAFTTLVFGGLAALALATTLRTIRGAVAGGVLIALTLVALLLFFAYVRG